jgi:hypothetical protein
MSAKVLNKRLNREFHSSKNIRRAKKRKPKMPDIDYAQNADRKRRLIIFASAIIALAILASIAGLFAGVANLMADWRFAPANLTADAIENAPSGDAGTAVLTLGGAVAIENIRKGDMVLSRNDVLGITEYKPVTDIYVYNDITEFTHVQYSDGDKIIATPNHPFYVFNRGYVEAGNLRAGDILLLSNGKTVVVEKIQHEILESPITVYNIEVAENSNYYIASNTDAMRDEYVLVHNASCARTMTKAATPIDGKAHGSAPHQAAINSKASELAATGKYEKIYLNKSLKTAGLVGKQRPDIIAIGKDGVKSEFWEVASKTQATGKPLEELEKKIATMHANNPSVTPNPKIPWEDVLKFFGGA